MWVPPDGSLSGMRWLLAVVGIVAVLLLLVGANEIIDALFHTEA